MNQRTRDPWEEHLTDVVHDYFDQGVATPAFQAYMQDRVAIQEQDEDLDVLLLYAIVGSGLLELFNNCQVDGQPDVDLWITAVTALLHAAQVYEAKCLAANDDDPTPPSELHDPAVLNEQDFLDSVEDIPHPQEAWYDDSGSSL